MCRRYTLAGFLRLNGPVFLAAACLLLLSLAVSPAYADGPVALNPQPTWFSDESGGTGVAWGDMDGDGDLDLAVGGGANRVYLNEGGALQTVAPIWTSDDGDFTESVAWGDVDGDGDLDLAAGSRFGPNKVYLNLNGMLATTASWTFGNDDYTNSVAWGDVDGDGDLDLAVGNSGAFSGSPNKVYLYEGGTLQTTAVWTSSNSNRTTSVAWGDVDGDGDLDLAVGNSYPFGNPNEVYLNVNGMLTTTASWTSDDSDLTNSLAWGDVDGDGDLDLAAGNRAAPNKVYLNVGGVLTTTLAWTSIVSDLTNSVAWGDVDGDGDLDLAAGNDGPDKVYLNVGGVLQTTAAWTSNDSDLTNSVAWGDVDGDGDLDLAASGLNKVYLNVGGVLQTTATTQTSILDEGATSVAWGDMDGDGDLDLAAGGSNKVYLNLGGLLTAAAVWPLDDKQTSSEVAWGDIDGDGDLDLAASNLESNKVYLNMAGVLTTTTAWTSSDSTSDRTNSLAWGDVDGDGDLDLAAGNRVAPNKVYLNVGGILQTTAAWASDDSDLTNSLAWGDVDGDGDLDLAAGNQGPNKVYLNVGGVLQTTAAWTSFDNNETKNVAWGDVDEDGDLDLAAGNSTFNKVYLNIDGMLQTTAAWTSGDSDYTNNVAWGDSDGDGDLDLAVGNGESPNKVYLNENGVLQATAAWTSGDGDDTQSVAWGDVDGDGDLDLAAGNGGSIKVYLNQRPAHPLYPGQTASLALNLSSDPVQTFSQTVTALAPADFYALPGVRQSGHIPISYTLYHPDSEPVRFIRAFYSPDGGGRWLEAMATSKTITINLATGPYPTATLANTHLFTWDVFGSNFFGQSDNVVFRLEAYPSLRPRPDRIPGPFQRPYVSAQTFPFRVRGHQVRVLSGMTPISDALVYRLPAGQPGGGFSLAGSSGVSFRTDNQGYLQGRGELALGDRLLALAPVDWTDTLTWAVGLTKTLHLYYTNDADVNMIPTYTITQPGVQTLQVSAANPLLLFDLAVSLEWDATKDPIYLSQLEADLKKASDFLYDFTNGQAALGKVTVLQNAEDWAFAEVVVQSTNRLRPFAVQGGLVLTTTPDPDHTHIVYDVGQVRMGATWNRYGNPGQSLGLDWPLALAHELSHFFFFQDDTYLGLNEEGLLIPIDSCVGSAMGDMYDPSGVNTEFLNDGDWLPHCAETLAQVTLGRSEVTTIKQRYPFYRATSNPGPNRLPFALTTVNILEPLTPTNVLADPTFFIDYEGGESSSAGARAFLLKQEQYVFDLGAPLGGQNRILARGAEPGDRLCVFDQPRRQYGCEIVDSTDERLELEKNEDWRPLIQLSPVNSQTFILNVDNLPAVERPLEARLYPQYGSAGKSITLTETNGVYSGTFALAYPALAGHIQVWVDETESETNPRRETIVAYIIGGNPGGRGGGPLNRGGGPLNRGGGPLNRGGGAPLISPDGQMIFFTENPLNFNDGELYVVQGMAGLPSLPAGKKALGRGYNLVASPNITRVITGSVSFQYLGMDALVAGIDEAGLMIHFWDGAAWQALETAGNAYYNLASAPSQGSGIYALLDGSTVPVVTAIAPTVATNAAPTELTISGQDFLQPMMVQLSGDADTYSLAARLVGTQTVIVQVPAGLPAQEYQVVVVNGDQAMTTAPATLSLFDPATACFYDFFESGSNQWQREGQWDIVTLPASGQRAMTDSPGGNYNSAITPEDTYTTAITSQAFSLAGCPNPRLTFHHDYVIDNRAPSQDVGRVEVSTDGGQTWTALAEYSGGDIFEGRTADDDGAEWTTVNWKPVDIDLSAYEGTIRLRFSLAVDQVGADKGWVIDDVLVDKGPENPGVYPIFLPLIVK